MAKTYSEKLKDPRWQRKRLEIFERDNWTCLKCGDITSTLHIHHKVYFKGVDPWEYDGKHLETLCENCHSAEHGLISQAQEPERWQLLLSVKEHGDNTLTAIQTHIDILMTKLSKGVPKELETEILKNIIYLQNKKRDYLKDNG
jgi:hypothetical protein